MNYTITHEITGGIRISQPSGSVLAFSNQVRLAEAHANLLSHRDDLLKTIDGVRKAVNEGPLESVRERVLKALNEDVPF